MEPAVLAGTWGYGRGPPAPGGTAHRRLPVRCGGSAQRTRTPGARQARSEGFSPFLGNVPHAGRHYEPQAAWGLLPPIGSCLAPCGLYLVAF
jgi:hypothetical protein